MAQQTAVEWLVEKVNIDCLNSCFIQPTLITQAKQMEKEQIVQAYVEGINLIPCDVNSTDELDAEKYYNKTFGK